jgi:hypothetical protein
VGHVTGIENNKYNKRIIHPWVPIATAGYIPSNCRRESRPPDMEVSCKYIE